MPAAEYSQICEYPLSLLKEIILDFENYFQIFSGLEQAKVTKSGPPIWEVKFSLFMIRRLKYTLSLESSDGDGYFELRWTLIDGFFHSNNGHWRLEDTENGTNVCYAINVLTDTLLPATMVQSLTTRRLPTVIHELFAEAERRSAGALEENDSDDG